MGKVLVVFSKSFLDDLAERPGRNKIEKEKAAAPRIVLQKVLERLSRDIQKAAPSHLRADIFDEPISTLRHYTPESLAVMLSNFRSRILVPLKSRYAAGHPNSYIVNFHFPRLKWSTLAAYIEIDDNPVLVFLHADQDTKIAARQNRIAAHTSEFESSFELAEKAAAEALDKGAAAA